MESFTHNKYANTQTYQVLPRTLTLRVTLETNLDLLSRSLCQRHHFRGQGM